MKHKNAMVLLSGGVDSTACTYFLIKQGFSVSGLFIDYGQNARGYEEESAKKICNLYDIDLKVCRIPTKNIFKAGEIIGRNAFLIFYALMFSGIKQGIIAIGIHSKTPYYDCSHSFFMQANTIIVNYSSGLISLFAPFLDWTKNEIIQYCKDNKIPLNLTYSCENGSLPPCGVCGSCKDRNLLIC